MRVVVLSKVLIFIVVAMAGDHSHTLFTKH